MRQVDVDEAKKHLSDLITDAISGEIIYITENGHQVQLVPVPMSTSAKPSQAPRRPGSAKGMIWMADDFDAPLEDFKEYME